MEKSSEVQVTQLCLTLVTPWTVAHQAPLSMWFSRQEYWVGCHFLLQGIFPTQELNPILLHCKQILYQLSYEGSLQRNQRSSRKASTSASWTLAHQAPLSMGFPRQEYWVGCHFLLQGIFLTQGSNLSLLWLLNWREILYLLNTGLTKEFVWVSP